MAANLDKSENSLTSVSTLTYLRGIDASGNSVKISTSDLASVLGVGNLMAKSIPSEITDANDLYTGIWNKTVVKTLAHMPNVDNVNTTPWFVFCFYGANVNQITWQQNSDGGPIFKRTRYGSGEWTNWVQINQHPYLSSYSDLAALVTGISGASNLSTLATALGESGINNMKITSVANITVPANGTYEISRVDCGLWFFRDCFNNGFSSFGMYHYRDGVNVISENNNNAISASNTSASVYISVSNNTMILTNNTDSDKIVSGFIVRCAKTA